MAPGGLLFWLLALAVTRLAGSQADAQSAQRSVRPQSDAAATAERIEAALDAIFPEITSDAKTDKFLQVTYSPSMQPLVKVMVGGQWLDFVFDASSGNTAVFVSESNACAPKGFKPCYSFVQAREHGYVHLCSENNDETKECKTGQGAQYPCQAPFLPPDLEHAKTHKDEFIIDGLTYDQVGVEGIDEVALHLGQAEVFSRPNMSVRLVKAPMFVPVRADEKFSSERLRLFEYASGVLGASGPSLGCRNGTIWASLLRDEQVKTLVLDWQPPSASKFAGNYEIPSRVVLNRVDRDGIVWSQPKQTGDAVNDGMHEFLLYRPTTCGVDLLYNTSSNWLAVVDTSGPCLALPPFLFDRLMVQVPVQCPFEIGKASGGRLCSPKRFGDNSSSRVTLPTLRFRLADSTEPPPPQLALPLERLVFRGNAGDELLCVNRADNDVHSKTADMMHSHIAFGSLAVAAFYVAVDLENNTVGLVSKANPDVESTDAYCAKPVTCVSPTQTYFPPLNICEDPDCSVFFLMTLDEKTRTCRWASPVAYWFGAALTALVGLDLLTHRLYKQAIAKAGETGQ